jgi:hypothetical protein
MPLPEQAAAAKAEQAAMRELQTEITRRDRHKAAGFVEVVEMCEVRVAEAYGRWRNCSLHRARLTCQAMGVTAAQISSSQPTQILPADPKPNP